MWLLDEVRVPRWVLLLAAALLLAVGVHAADAADPDAPCVYVSPRTLGVIVRDAAIAASSYCPPAPACVCPELPQQFVVCTQRLDGKVTKCKRLFLRPTVLP